MTKIWFCILLLFLIQPGVFCQLPEFHWTATPGGIGIDQANDVVTDQNGNSYTIGNFQETVNFDPIGISELSSMGGNDVFIQKLNPSGELIWIKSLGSGGNDQGNGIAIDPNGYIYAAGAFQETVDFDPGNGTYLEETNSLFDVFVLKLDLDGNFVWVRTFGGNNVDVAYSVDIDNLGNVYTSGIFRNNVDFDPGTGFTQLTANGEYDYFVQMMNPDGDFQWARSIGGSEVEEGYLAIDAFFNVYSFGHFADTVDFDPGPGTFLMAAEGEHDMFIQKLNANGDFIWAKQLGGPNFNIAGDITIDNQGDLIIVGYFRESCVMDSWTGLYEFTSTGAQDMFVQKLDSDGNLQWAKQIGGFDDQQASAVTVDDQDNIYVGGQFAGVTDFNPESGTILYSALGGNDGFVQKFYADGSVHWIGHFEGADTDRVNAVAVDNFSNVISVGQFWGTADLDPTNGVSMYTSNGDYDLFIQKLRLCDIEVGTDVQIACDSLVWIDGNTYTEDNNSASFVMEGVAVNGCDSIVQLDLTIKTVSYSGVAVNGNLLTANADSAAYQWLDCNDNYELINGETANEFEAAASGIYAVQISENGCIDTSVCVNVSVLGLNESIPTVAFECYPNPNNGQFQIQLNRQHAFFNIEVFDPVGRRQGFFQAQNTDLLELDLNLSAGLYLIRLSTPAGTIAKSLILH